MIKPQPIYYPLYRDKDKFIILITGGRGSGKSFNASAFIERLTFEKSLDRSFAHAILYTRYTMVSAHISIIPEMTEKIEMDGTLYTVVAVALNRWAHFKTLFCERVNL